MRVFATLAALLIVLVPAFAAAAEPRLALVIGNNTYAGGLGPLSNAVNDAVLISGTLRRAGFEVEELHDAGRSELSTAIARFGERLRAAGPGAVGLFYFAGHGLQSYGTNYLVATDAPVATPDDISRFGLDADTVLRAMIRAGADTNILILDACRPNRVAEILRPVSAAGLLEIDARGLDPDRSVFIAYSTGLGETAADGADGNSPYARTLSEHMLTPGLPLEILFRNVRVAMLRNGFQKPWESNGMVRGLAFVGEPQGEPGEPSAARIEPGRIVQVTDFSAVPAELGTDRFVPAARFLRQGRVPVEVRDVTPATSEILFYGTDELYEGNAVSSTISANVLTQANTGNQAAGFTLAFPQPAVRVRFLIPRLFAATESGVTFPAWKAMVLSEAGEVLDSSERGVTGSYTEIPEQFIELRSRDGRGIAAVRFESDPRVNGVPFAAFSALLIEGIWIEPM